MNHWNMPLQNQLTAWLSRRTAASGVRRIVPLASAVASDIGNVRSDNQDRVAIARGRDRQGREFVVAAVSDGIGGMRHGAECAALSLGTFLTVLSQQARSGAEHSSEWMHHAVHAANLAVYSKFRGDGGATLVSVLIRQGSPAYWLSVGDSRVYRSSAKELVQVSVDDTIAGQFGNAAGSNAEQSKLLQFVGMGDDLEPHIDDFRGEPVDSVVLTTDGVHYLASSPGWFGRIVDNSPDVGACAKRLIDLAKWCGGPDNATVAIVSLKSCSELQDKQDYQYLEVWDAYGELQVILETNRKASSIVERRPREAFVRRVQDSAAVNVSSEKPEGLDPEANAQKSRRFRSQVKNKIISEKKEKKSIVSSKEGEPQLLMEFPNKNK